MWRLRWRTTRVPVGPPIGSRASEFASASETGFTVAEFAMADRSLTAGLPHLCQCRIEFPDAYEVLRLCRQCIGVNQFDVSLFA